MSWGHSWTADRPPVSLSPMVACLNKPYSIRNSSSVGLCVSVFSRSAASWNLCGQRGMSKSVHRKCGTIVNYIITLELHRGTGRVSLAHQRPGSPLGGHQLCTKRNPFEVGILHLYSHKRYFPTKCTYRPSPDGRIWALAFSGRWKVFNLSTTYRIQKKVPLCLSLLNLVWNPHGDFL